MSKSPGGSRNRHGLAQDVRRGVRGAHHGFRADLRESAGALQSGGRGAQPATDGPAETPSEYCSGAVGPMSTQPMDANTEHKYLAELRFLGDSVDYYAKYFRFPR